MFWSAYLRTRVLLGEWVEDGTARQSLWERRFGRGRWSENARGRVADHLIFEGKEETLLFHFEEWEREFRKSIGHETIKNIKNEKKKKIGSRPSLVHELSARHALSGQGSTGAKRGVKHEDVGFVTRAKRGAHAKRAIQHKHTLNLLHALSAWSERAKHGVSR